MASTKNLLIVSASAGTGHTRAAEALRAAAARHERWGQVEHVDLLELAPAWVRAAYGDAYELIASRAPRLWSHLYRRTDSPDGDLARWGPIAHRILFREFRRLLKSHSWSTCLATHFLPGQLAAGITGLPPFALAITDLTLHRVWVQPRVTRYFVGCDALAVGLRARVPRARVEVSGIPISPAFEGPPDRAQARRELGLEDQEPAVLVMGGGLGLGVESTVEAVAAAKVPGLQVLAVCGRNDQTASRLRLSNRLGPRLRVFGYVDLIERFIMAADLVVTKPGGLTTSEALALGRPLLLTHPIPGQEEGNAEVLSAAGAARRADTAAEVTAEVEGLFARPHELAMLTAAAASLGHPRAARTVIDSLWRDVAMRSAA